MSVIHSVESKIFDVVILEDNKSSLRSILDCLEEFAEPSKIKTFSTENDIWKFIDRQNILSCLHHKYRPKLILLDLKVNGVKSFRTIQYLRKLKLTRYTPIVVFSDSDDEDDVRKCYKYGASAYVRKPVLYEEFDEVVQAIAYFWLDINRTY
jgi:two-component system, response regulator